jgi:hypothetical protein
MDKLEHIINEEEDKEDVYEPANYEKIVYSTNERCFLLNILHEFKLCFLVKERNEFIIPDLLDTAEPLDVTDPIRSSGESIQFVYDYDYLPKSVMPNMMVEMYLMIEHQWRTGCVLHKNDCKALITNYQNRISITVTGEYKKKREFMAVIRNIIDAINHKLSNKQVSLIPLPGIKDGFALYERLLIREKKGELYYIHDEDMPTEKRFQISELLDGIPSQDDVRNSAIQKIKIFLASSAEFKEDREQFEIFIYRENKELINKGIFLDLVMWEDFIDCMSKTRLQDEYNKAVAGSDIFVSLFWTKAGKYTKEEFREAFGHFKENNKPFVYTYFKNAAIKPSVDIRSRLEFIGELKELEHYPTYYENIQDLQLKFNKQLSKLLEKLIKK